MPKKYRLLKGLPNAKVGEIYYQTLNEKDYVNYNAMNTWDVCYPAEYVERNPTWFEEIKEKERVLVTSVGYASKEGKDVITIETMPHKWYAYDHEFPNEKVWKGVEAILNKEQPKEEGQHFHTVHEFTQGTEKMYVNGIEYVPKETITPLSGTMVTLEECERREKLVFEWTMEELDEYFYSAKYPRPTFEDYKKQNKSL